ncbi:MULTISPECIES: response regulator transcription factor [Enterococcus]|uniref:response regulator transcription factor n=1 Tax=Enterococcus TaxID=1350 RepID=UPI000A34D75F|nr:hypothetical protein A5852_000671 [Enterococcus faecium]
MYRCLIVDDEKISRDGIAQSIDWQNLGIEIVGLAKNGAEGLAMFRETTPEIVLSDIQMPIMDGLALAKKIKTQAPETKIIILSAFGEFSYAQEAIQHGVQNYLLKPIDEKELEEALIKLLQEIQIENKRKHQRHTIDLLFKREIIPLIKNTGIVTVLDAEGFIPTGGEGIEGEWEGNRISILRLTHFTYERIILSGQKGFYSSYRSDGNIVKSYQEARMVMTIASFWSRTNLTYWRVEQQRKKWRQFRFERNNEVNKSSRKLVEALHQSCQSEIQETLTSFFRLLKQFVGLDAEEMKTTCMNLLRKVNEYSNFLAEEEQRPFQEEIMALTTFDQIEEKMYQLFAELLINYQNLDQQAHLSIIEKIDRIIEQQMAGDLTNQTIAEQVFLSPNYMAATFKALTGRLLSEYITEKRLEKAKELLLTTNLPIVKIAKQVGFSSQSYFTKNFKRFFGVTPKRFKQLHWSKQGVEDEKESNYL